jgi:anaerobic selenocysteine-containing dehydrogenase/thioredoxin reductase
MDIKTETTIGKDLSLHDIRESHDAVLLAVGSWKPINLKIPGSELKGVYNALAFLQDVKEGKNIDLGKKVIVIGGGDTAMDVARTALRLGVGEVHLACLEDRRAMPAHEWEIEKAQGEGVVIHLSLAPQRFRGHKTISEADFRVVTSTNRDREGKITWTLKEGPKSEKKMDADSVIVAIGQLPDLNSFGDNEKLTVTSHGTLKVDPDTLACDNFGLFAAGDIVAGAGTVLEAIAEGRKSAASIIKHLSGFEPEKRKPVTAEAIKKAQAKMSPDLIIKETRGKMPAIPLKEAIKSFKEVELGYTEEIATSEAKRCINCVASCIKGMTIPDVMYHPDRLRYPLKRIGERGAGKWERISWEEAISIIAGKLKEIKETHGPEAIHVSCGSGQKHIGIQATKIAERLWPTPNTHLGRYTCIHPDVMSNSVTFGDTVTYEFGPDYSHSNCIVFWGSEPDVATPSQAREIRRALKRGAKLIVIDPRPIPLAKRADIWLRIRPGTDTAFGLAMQHVIINEELYDKEFVENFCSGFDKLKEHVQKYSPEWAAEITGLAKADIIKAARMYATNNPASIYIRLGSGAQQVTSTQTCRTISILVGITGNVDAEGGNLLYYRTFREALFWQTYLMFWGVKPPAALNEKRIGAKDYPLMHKRALCDVPGTVRAMDEGGIKALWCVANNLIVAELDSRKLWHIMKNKLDFIFVSEFFMTPTAELADIVLPAAFYTECDLLVAAFGHPSSSITASKKVVEPLGECRDDREVAIEIAKEMGMDVTPWETVKDYLNWRLKYQEVTYDELCEKPECRIVLPRRYQRYRESTPPFSTASGKVELYSSVLEAMGQDPLPVYHEPPESPISTPERFKEFPLIYTHYRIHSYMHSEGRQIKRQRQLAKDPCLEINPETASKLGIAAGDWVYLETPRSEGEWHISFRARLVPDMHPDVVAGPHAWWFPEKPGPEHGCFESNINALLTLDPPYDPIVGVPQCRAILCRIKKAES